MAKYRWSSVVNTGLEEIDCTSSQFWQDSPRFLCRHPQFSQLQHWKVAVHFNTEEGGDFEDPDFCDSSDEPVDSIEITFAGDPNLNLDAANLHTLDLQSAVKS